MKGGSFTTWSRSPAEVRFLPSPRNWDIGVLSPLMVYLSKRSLPGWIVMQSYNNENLSNATEPFTLKWLTW